MKTHLSTAAHAVSQQAAQQGIPLKRSQAFEILAALLGYGSYAALTVEEADTTLPYHLEDAEFYVLNVPFAQGRARALGLSPAVVDFCTNTLKAVVPEPVFVSVDDFYDSHAREALEGAIVDGEHVSSAMADSNAIYPDMLDLEGWEQSEDLWTSPDQWSIGASGTMSGEYDPDGDRMFNGDTLNVWGKLIYDKAGRSGLVLFENEDGAGADDSWRDDGLMEADV